METWRDITIVHRGEAVAIDGVGFSAIGRLELLQLLQQRARAAGVTCAFDTPCGSLDELAGYDLIVGRRRRELAGAPHASRPTFGASLSHLANKFVWYGTTKPSTR